MARIEGDWIAAVNQAGHVKGSIHDEARARELGFDHAVVGAGMHIPLVTKHAVALFGARWYERGFLEARFGSPMHDGEEVRLVLEDVDASPHEERALALTLEKRDGATPLTGWLGLHSLEARLVAPWERNGAPKAVTNGLYDPLPFDKVGTTFQAKAFTFDAGASLPALRVVSDPCTWYELSSPWGGPILPTHRFVPLPRLAGDLNPPEDVTLDMRSSMNAFFQIAHAGPVLCGREYSVQVTLVEKGFSGRSAFRTSEAVVSRDGTVHARVRQMLRWIPQRAMPETA